ncbi:hypothetical protein [Microbacterium sp.]|uniref:hypothetical protein n=1 Tax=Microbacterium sp. TaxID=51671 RepID=UPI0039E37F75
MIGAGLVLLGVGVGDLLRQYAPSRLRIAATVLAAIALVVLAAGADAMVWAFVALGTAVLWTWGTPDRRGGPAGLWPVVLVAVVCLVAVAVIGIRADQGPWGEFWPTGGPLSRVSADVAVFVVGAVAFLSESGNVVVRASLRDAALPDADGITLKGGRLIGPLERLLVFSLTLTGAFTLLAAVLAAKGIVRFPEISRDSGSGLRAEYFLIGSLVSWATALGVAFLLWWGTLG